MTDRFANGGSDRDPTLLAKARAVILAGLDEEAGAGYGEWVEWMKEVGPGKHALQPGDRLPDFVLPDADGHLVSSGELLEHGPLVISFILGDWCPFCCAELRAYEQCIAEIHRLGARLVAITPDTNGYPRRLMRNAELENVKILSDVDYGFSLACGLLFSVPPVGCAFLGRKSVDLPQRHGTSAWMLPIPATYIAESGGMISLAHVDPDFTCREEPSIVITHLARSW